MHLGKPAGQTSKRVVFWVMLFLAFLFTLFFWNEITWLITGVPYEQQIDETVQNPVLNPWDFLTSVCFFSFIMVFVLWAMLISFQALLPVSNLLEDRDQCLKDVYRTAWHLLLYMFRFHGPAIFVKDGKTNETSEDLQRENMPGVVVVDFNSAVVLEERNSPPGLTGAFLNLLMLFLEALYLSDRKKSPRVQGQKADVHAAAPRVHGAGIIFTRPRERIRGAVDLRKQFRLQPKVQCYTREGIELSANIITLFTIGQDPDVLQVTYTGDSRPENLSVITVEKAGDSLVQVSKFNDDPNELDLSDRNEIHAYALKNGFPHHPPVREPYSFLKALPKHVQFDPDRVLNAVYAQARTGKQDTLSWTDLPTRVAAGFYREILSQVNYDELYDIKGNGKFPLWEFKAKLRFAMRNNGILAYRLVFTCSGKPLVKGRLYRPDELLVSPVVSLTNSKVLRDRGIKILLGSFGDPSPVNEAIYKQRLDSWRAEWERDLDISLAARELDAMRERARAHSEAQRDMWYSLSQLFESHQYNEEALTLRVLQAIESAASDPKTRSLLPGHTIDLLLRMDRMLLPTPNLRSHGTTDSPGIPNPTGDSP